MPSESVEREATQRAVGMHDGLLDIRWDSAFEVNVEVTTIDLVARVAHAFVAQKNGESSPILTRFCKSESRNKFLYNSWVGGGSAYRILTDLSQ